MRWNYADLASERMRRREERMRMKELQRQERLRLLAERLPRLAEIEAEQRNTVMQLAQSFLQKRVDIAKVQQQGTALSAERSRVLAAAGIDPADLDLFYDCPTCKDAGWVEPAWEPGQETVGEPRKCDCQRKAEVEDLFAAAGISGPLRSISFEKFRIDVYPLNLRTHMESVLRTCRTYADGATQGSSLRGLFLYGGVGTGKTLLATAIANSVLANGRSVVYATWAEYLDVVRMWRLADDVNQRQSVQKLLEAHLVVLDDLGAEKITDFVGQELFNLINHRMLHDLPTVVSSNLRPDQIEAYYGQRIASRLSYGYDTLDMEGPDLRAQLSKAQTGRM